LNDKLQLHIKEAKVEDAGRYSCIAENKVGRAEKDLVVSILKPPLMETRLATVEVERSHPLTLQCPIKDSAVEFLWTKNSIPITTSERIQTSLRRDKLYFIHVEPADSAHYACIAKNEAGEDQAVFDTIVNAPPRVFMQSEEMKVVAGRGATIRCEVFGDPPPAVEWLKNGQPFKSENLQSSINLRYLHISEASVDDAGRYTCIAMNQAGEQRVSTHLHVLVIPVIEDGERVIQVKENSTLIIDCVAGGIPSPQITWKKDGVQLDGILGSRLTVPRAMISDVGRYTCTAGNEAGHVSADFAVDVFSRPKFKEILTDVQVVVILVLLFFKKRRRNASISMT
uniref:Immunoglobulin I-set domain protein n=1 Tax=Angiostrongylus cantonensis TaxID=6313 RepID=A0A0K0D5C9_ANGCA